MAIPIPIPALASTRIGATPPNLSASTAPTRALGDLASGIASVSSAFHGHADKIQGFENARMESETRQEIARTYAEFETRIATNSDPAAYLPELEKILTHTQTLTESEKLPPTTRERLTLWHSDFANQARIRAAKDASSLSLKRAGMALQTELERASAHGDQAAFDDVLARGTEAGLLLPEETTSKQNQFAQAQAHNTIAAAVDADPDDALDQLLSDDILTRYPNLTPENRDRLISYARQKRNTNRLETWDEISRASIEGAVLSKDDILSMVKDGDLDPDQAGSYIRAYHGPDPITHDPILYNQARSLILTYDPANDESGEQRALISTHLATLPLPKESITELRGQFQNRLNPTPEQSIRHKLTTEYANRIESEWKAEAFGDWFDMEKDPIDGRIARKTIRQGDFDTALAYKTRVTDAFQTWLDQQPADIDPTQVGKKYDEIKSQALDATAPLDLGPSFAPLPSFDDVDSLINPASSADLLPPKPTDPDTPPTTSSIQKFDTPIKLSNYGYRSDTTPDSFSAKGIGHKNNRLIDGRSAAISKSLATRLGLKHDDWLEVHTTRGTFQVQYHDTVPSTDKRTGPLPETIDIYRRANGSNSWGGKVTAYRKIDPPQIQTGSLDQKKQNFFRSTRPRTPDEIDIGLRALYADHYSTDLA